MRTIGFIGMGNMGRAILDGVAKERGTEALVFTCRRAAHREQVEKETGAKALPGNLAVAEAADIIVLAVKPVVYPDVLPVVKQAVSAPGAEGKLVISLAPGYDLETLKVQLGGFTRVVRVMPNTPAKVGCGFTGFCYDEKCFTEEDVKEIHEVLESIGLAEKVEERLMDAVTAVSGSGPAYVFLFLEALADAGVRYGLPRDTAMRMAAQTVLGSAELMLKTGLHPGVLKDQVCSPAGTTIEGVAALEAAGLRNAVLCGADAVYQKCLKMKQK